MANELARRRDPFSYTEALLLIVGFMIVSLTFAGFVLLVEDIDESISLPMLAIAGIILLLIFLAGIAYVFVRAGLQDRSQALGLPPGSIQAVIALSLIVLFAILSIYIFTSLGQATMLKRFVITEAGRDTQVKQLGDKFAGWKADGSSGFTVFVREPPSNVRDDVGKQLIVLIGTLMTSAVSFYFGSRATAAGVTSVAGPRNQEQPSSSDVSDATPKIIHVEPAAGVSKGSMSQITIVGENLAGTDSVQIVLSNELIVATNLEQMAHGLTCNVNPPSTVSSGNYDVALMKAGLPYVRANGAIKIV